MFNFLKWILFQNQYWTNLRGLKSWPVRIENKYSLAFQMNLFGALNLITYLILWKTQFHMFFFLWEWPKKDDRCILWKICILLWSSNLWNLSMNSMKSLRNHIKKSGNTQQLGRVTSFWAGQGQDGYSKMSLKRNVASYRSSSVFPGLVKIQHPLFQIFQIGQWE